MNNDMSSLFQIVPKISKFDRSIAFVVALSRSIDFSSTLPSPILHLAGAILNSGNDQIAIDVFSGLIRVF
jgi:hypothetical protein